MSLCDVEKRMLEPQKTTWMTWLIVSAVVCGFAVNASAVKIGDDQHHARPRQKPKCQISANGFHACAST